MKKFFSKLFSKNKTSNIYKIKRKKNSYDYNSKKYNHENAIFEITRAFNMGENQSLICGKVLNGSFRVGDKIKICEDKNAVPKLETTIDKITTSLVEVNKINKGAKTDMLLNAAFNETNKIFPGNKAYKY